MHGMTVEEVMALPSIGALIHEADLGRLTSYAHERLSGAVRHPATAIAPCTGAGG
ncbi:MAG: hypothetical protein HC871_10505 [Rhizobiales bacterium]|nr:hypothetical protein [Hyphomicrobiales bacterium]